MQELGYCPKCTPELQWNHSKVDTIRTKILSAVARCPLTQGLVVLDNAPPTISASYHDKALLWTTDKIVLMRDLSTDSF